MSIRKTTSNTFNYDIIIDNTTNSSLESRNTDAENELIIRNNSTNEFIEIINIQEHEDYYTFDLRNNLGNRVNEFTYHGEMFLSNTNRCPACVRIVTTLLISAAVELLSDSSLEECNNAMSSLDCGEDSPYMTFSESWFSTSCEVGCR